MSDSEELNLNDLKNEATSLGVTFNKTIGAVKLKEKIEKHYESKETSGTAVEAAVEKNEKAKTVTAAPAKSVKGLTPKQVKRHAREKAARKLRVVTVVDNDNRVNNEANTCTVNCSNEYFDLGTKILPLNEKIEVAQGHINVLKSVAIPLHIKDNRTGLSTVRMRERYSISYADMS